MNNEINWELIRWNIHVVPRECKGGVVVGLHWGWSSPYDNDELAEDAPKGFDYVLTTLDGAIVLRDALTKIIDDFRAIDKRLQVEWEEEMKPLQEQLEKYFPLLNNETP